MSSEIILQQAERLPVSRQNYTESLLARAAQEGTISAERLEAIREELHRAAAARIGSFTDGLTSSVSRQTAEQFYISLLCQLDAALLRTQTDEQAELMLKDLPLQDLLQLGMRCVMEDYETAKEQFRAAYPVLHRYETLAVVSLIEEFALFITNYDARTRAADTYVSFLYPTMDNETVPERGAAGVCRYYAKLRGEAAVLSCFPEEELKALFERYAALYRTDPFNIAENLGEVALRHWFIAALAEGAENRSVRVTEEMVQTVSARFGGAPLSAFADAMETAVRESFFAEQPPLPDGSTVTAHILKAVPYLAQQLHSRLLPLRLSGYLGIVS